MRMPIYLSSKGSSSGKAGEQSSAGGMWKTQRGHKVVVCLQLHMTIPSKA